MLTAMDYLKNGAKQLLTVVAKVYCFLYFPFFGEKLVFTKKIARKHFDERKSFYHDVAMWVAITIFVLLLLFFHFCAPSTNFLVRLFVSFFFSVLCFMFAMLPVYLTDAIIDFLQPLRYPISPFPALYFLSNTYFQSRLIPVPTTPPRFKLAAKSTKL